MFQDSAETAQSTKQEPKKAESWTRSVGTLSSKGSLANLVKKKPASKAETKKSPTSICADVTKPPTSNSTNQSIPSTDTQRLVATALSKQAEAQDAAKVSAASGPVNTADKADSVAQPPRGTASHAEVTSSDRNRTICAAAGSALGLLGGYSGSDSDSS